MTMTADADPMSVANGDVQRPIIETIDLVKTYAGADFRAVDGVNLSVGMGEIYGLLGPNGAGKTTTVGVLTTRVIPTGGRPSSGHRCRGPSTLAKQMIGVVSQQNTLDRQLTPWENLYYHGRLFGIGKRESKQTADELLEQFQLTRFARASVYALSGGMAQRLMVARRSSTARPSSSSTNQPQGSTTGPLGPVGSPAWPQRRRADDHADHPLHGGSRQALPPGGDHGPRQNPRPGHSRGAQTKRGADTIVTVKADADADALAAAFTRRIDGVTRTRTVPRRGAARTGRRSIGAPCRRGR